MKLDAFASEPHFAEHLAAVWAAVEPRRRGRFMVRDPRTAAALAALGVETTDVEHGDGACLVSATGDMRLAHAIGRRHVALMQHGAGQSYGGSQHKHNREHPAYAGGARRDAELFLHPGEHPAARDRARYPDALVRVVGSPILDTLPERDDGPRPVIAFAFHFEATIAPETRPAFAWIREELVRLAATGRYTILGHGHPRMIDRLAGSYARMGIETVRSFAEVCRRADVLVADNTSAMYAFAANGGQVVVLNPPHYRRNVDHGLRFWDAATVGLNVDRPGDLEPSLVATLDGSPALTTARDAAVDLVYAYRSGAALRAAQELDEWLDSLPAPVPAVVPFQMRDSARAATRPSRRARLDGPPIGTITVGMPYRGVPELVDRAVASVLAQTHTDLRLIVIGDGETPPVDVDDRRVTVYTLPEQRGAYFAHAVALAASPDAWYAPHDADDWSDPEHLARLVSIERARKTGAVIAASIFRHDGPAVAEVRTSCWMGLYAHDRLVDVGGFDVAARFAQDSYLVELLKLTGRVAKQDVATYHAVRRPGSLTMDPETGLESAARAAVRAENARSLAGLAGHPASTISSRRRRAMPKALRDEVDRHARAIRRELERSVAA